MSSCVNLECLQGIFAFAKGKALEENKLKLFSLVLSLKRLYATKMELTDSSVVNGPICHRKSLLRTVL